MDRQQTELDFVNRRFDRDAIAFDAIYNEDERGFYKWFNRNFRKPVYERFNIAFETMGNLQDKTIIDVGCGSGVYCVKAALKGAKRVLGIDFSAEMLTLAALKIDKNAMAAICELKQANFLELNHQEKFNFSLAMGVFDYLSNPIPFLQKLKDVTIEQVIASFPGHSVIREPLRKLRYRLTIRGNVYFYSKSDIEKMVAAVGFRCYDLVPTKTGSGFVLVATP